MYVSCCDYLLAVKIYNKQLPPNCQKLLLPKPHNQPLLHLSISHGRPLSSTCSIHLLNNRSLNKLTERNFSRKTLATVYPYRLGASCPPKYTQARLNNFIILRTGLDWECSGLLPT